MANLSVSIGSLTLKNPVLASAGTFGYGVEFSQDVTLEDLGGIIIKTLTYKPRMGNPSPRLIETPSGMMNAVGLQNIGYEAFIREKLPLLKAYEVPIIVSLQAQSNEELKQMVPAIERESQVAGIELNLSCPNVKHAAGHADRGKPVPVTLISQDAAATAELIHTARALTHKPLWAKLSPESENLIPIAQAAEKAGADAVSLVNTFVGMSIDPETHRSRLGSLTGGLSGPAIRPLAVYRVWYTAQHISIPIIGMGGIANASDAVEFFLAGAQAVAVGTAHFADPRRIKKIVRGLDQYLDKRQLPTVSSLYGALQQ